jgi:hypothetical protein
MKKTFLVISLILISVVLCSAQKNVVVLEKPGNVKNFKYFEGDKIEIQTTDSLEVKGMITAIRDTSIVMNFYTEVSINKIKTVYRTRWAVSILSKVLMIGGVGLVLVEAVNGAISSNGNMNENYLYIGAGTAAAGALLIPLQKAKYHIAPDKWKIKILPIDKEFQYQKNKTIQF